MTRPADRGPIYRIFGENIYKTHIRKEDKQAIIDATSDWRADGQMDLEEFEYVFPRWLEQNEEILDHTEAQTGQQGTDWWDEEPVWGKSMTEGIYLKSDDTCIGFERCRILEWSMSNEITALVPSARENGYYIENSSLGLKTLFETFGCRSIITQTPTSVNTSKQPYKDITPTKVETRLDRITPVEYRETILTREWYTQWINEPEQSTLKNIPYTYHWKYTE